jgi:hypothetical protein
MGSKRVLDIAIARWVTKLDDHRKAFSGSNPLKLNNKIVDLLSTLRYLYSSQWLKLLQIPDSSHVIFYLRIIQEAFNCINDSLFIGRDLKLQRWDLQ